jgi:hypothetical protein
MNISARGVGEVSSPIGFLKGNEAKMAQLASTAMGRRSDEDVMLAAQADTEAIRWRQRYSR